jgi:hypothetical protein
MNMKRNVEHRTPNIERRISNRAPQEGEFDVRRSMFDVRCFPFLIL